MKKTNSFLPGKNYIVILKEEHKYSDRPLSVEDASKDYPESIITMEPGSILWAQEETFTIEQVAEAKKSGFPYQWGFGPCCEQVPFEKIQFAKIETINI